MEAASISSTSFSITPISNTTPSSNYSKSNTVSFSFRRRSRRFCSNNLIANGRSAAAPVAAAINDVSAVAHPAQVEVTWQIIVGTIAGVTPFVVAGIEFGKRIIAQRRCEVCGGSGLVLREKDYCKCPGCGGFLPWQSWRRFFTG
ncbi:putative Transmembrane protein [Melia azedarach]|uniref:Transmembrane protein n=1 Tax=Melia azedarach TaxID=155640 RepID=A0ACC1YN84_MELAZ|nr:putative Transmembrane protein [Melia azedarach]